MVYFICYDITDQRRLSKVAKFLEKKGIRMQYSFFSCEVDEKEYKLIKKELLKLINVEEDKLCFVPICDKCLKKIVYIGCDQSFIIPDFVVL